MKFKVGDKVRVKKGLKDSIKGWVRSMEEFEGKIVTIKMIVNKYEGIKYATIEGSSFNWDLNAFEPINKKPTKEELLKMPIGTKITTNRDEDNIFVKISDDVFENNYDECVWDTDIEEDLSITDIEYGDKIIKIEVPTYETVYDSSKEVKEMTMDEICKALGYNVKIIKEEN